MTIDEILSGYTNNEKAASGFFNYSLDGMARILSETGNPHNQFKSIHVAGTNGKGSVCHFLESVLSGHSLSTGLYTSPHLSCINERIRINRTNVTDSDLLNALAQIHDAARKNATMLTWFDIMTAASFLIFAEKRLDAAIIETGLGGTLDSTNVITPEISVITGVSLDHTHILGRTIAEIASNKAGIIKKNKPVITAAENDALKVITAKAAELSAPLFVFGKDFSTENIQNKDNGITFDYHSGSRSILKIEINHPGFFQSVNASIALFAAEQLSLSGGFIFDPEKAKKAVSGTQIPGRMEILSENPLLIFDPAHNEEAFSALIKMISRTYNRMRVTVFISLMKDKNPEKLLQLISSETDWKIVYCELDDSRAYTPQNGLKTVKSSDISSIIPEIGRNCLNIFTGSFRLFTTAAAVSEAIAKN